MKKNVKLVLYSTLLKKLEALKTKVSIIFFFLQKYYQISWTMLDFIFLLQSLQYWVSIISTLGEWSYPSLSIYQFRTFYHLPFQCQEILLRFPVRGRLFVRATSSGTSSSSCYDPFPHLHFSFPQFLWLHIQNGSRANVPGSDFFF